MKPVVSKAYSSEQLNLSHRDTYYQKMLQLEFIMITVNKKYKTVINDKINVLCKVL